MYVGREWPNLGGLAPRHTQRPPIYRDPLFPRPCQKKKPTQYSLLQQMPRKTLIGDIAMVIVKFRPRWPHIYALHSLSRPTMTAGRLRKMYTRSRRRVDEQAVAKYGVIL